VSVPYPIHHQASRRASIPLPFQPTQYPYWGNVGRAPGLGGTPSKFIKYRKVPPVLVQSPRIPTPQHPATRVPPHGDIVPLTALPQRHGSDAERACIPWIPSTSPGSRRNVCCLAHSIRTSNPHILAELWLGQGCDGNSVNYAPGSDPTAPDCRTVRC
jgi:hypothetical protein